MTSYLSTFIAGFGEVISKELVKSLPEVEIKLLLDGLIVYETFATPDEVAKLPYFNNSYYILHFFKNIEPGSLSSMVKFIYQSDFLKRVAIPKVDSRNRTFRVIVSRENELGVIDLNLLKNIEGKLAKGTGLTLERSKPDLEFWFLERSEGVGFFSLRLTYKHSTLNLNPGELRPELAYILCLLSDPKKEDIFLDPFCGWASIPLARLKFSHSKILCSDIDKSKVNRAKSLGLEAEVSDASRLSFLEDSSVDKIVTDPPWGLAEKVDVDFLYNKMMNELIRVVKPDGILVILTSKKLILEKLINRYPKLKLLEKYNILVNGKKAGVYKLSKIATS